MLEQVGGHSQIEAAETVIAGRIARIPYAESVGDFGLSNAIRGKIDAPRVITTAEKLLHDEAEGGTDVQHASRCRVDARDHLRQGVGEGRFVTAEDRSRQRHGLAVALCLEVLGTVVGRV